VNFTFGLADLDGGMLGPQCLGAPRIYNRKVARENHDAGILWVNNRGEARRNQRVDLWAMLQAGNYRYIMQYSFHADGVVSCLLGPTAHNLRDSKDDVDTTHAHTGCWRITPVLGYAEADATSLIFTSVSHVSALEGTPTPTQETPFNNGREGGEVWSAEKFQSLKITSAVNRNSHSPPSNFSYDLMPVRFGNLRRQDEDLQWVNRDTWITHDLSPLGGQQLRYQMVDQYSAEARPLSGNRCVVWHQSGFIHRAKDEDFGPNGYDAGEGSATINYVGLMLKPRNIHAGTPFYPR
jgi:Cu2+-containing amine oxidase